MNDNFDAQKTTSYEPRLEDVFEERIRRRAERRHRIIMILIPIAAAITVFAVAAVLFKIIFSGTTGKEVKADKKSSASRSTSTIAVTANKSSQVTYENQTPGNTSSQNIKQVINVLIVAVEGPDGHEKAKGLLLAKVDLQNGSINAINIPDKTYLNISGIGLDKISESFVNGIDSAKKAVQDFLQVPVDNYIIVKPADFDYLTEGNHLQDAFGKAVQTGFSDSEKKEYGKRVSKIDISKINVTMLPVKLVSINGEPFYQPANEEVSRLVESIWGIKITIKTDIIRVMIINGTGQPGVGRSIIEKLKPGGFIVVDTKNASSFNYKKTSIIAYKEEFMDQARRIRDILGTGEAVCHPVAQNVAEIAIVVGQDFNPMN